MAHDPLLDRYLDDLDRALSPLPISDRIDLLAQIKNRALTLAAGGSMEAALREVGPPEAVAERYLTEKGLPGGKGKSSAMRGILTAFFTTVAVLFLLTVAGAAYLMWRFSPLVQIDEANQRVRLLGGYVDLDGREGKIRIGDSLVSSDEFDRTFSLTKTLEPGAKAFEAQFSQGSLSIAHSTDRQVRIQCRIKGGGEGSPLQVARGKNVLSLGATQGSRCKVQIPSGIGVDVRGKNGKIVLENLDAPARAELGNGRIVIARPAAATDAEVENGKIEVEPDPSRFYRFETKVELGTQDRLETSTRPDAIPIRLTVRRGSLTVEDDLGQEE